MSKTSTSTASVDALPEELLQACLAAIKAPRNFAAAAQVNTRWHAASKLCAHWAGHIMLCKLARRDVMPLVVGAPDGRTCIDSAAFYDKYSCHVDEEEGSRTSSSAGARRTVRVSACAPRPRCPRLLRPWGAFLSGGHQDRYKLLPSEDSPMQPNALLVDGERLLVGANDRIYVWSGLEQPQDAPPALAHVLEVQHSRRGGGRNIDGVCALAVAPEREQMFVGINGAHGFADGSGPPNTECTVQVWHLPCIDLGGSSSTPSCLHVLPAGCMGSITAMLLVSGGARLFAWSSDEMLRVWQIHPEEGTGCAGRRFLVVCSRAAACAVGDWWRCPAPFARGRARHPD